MRPTGSACRGKSYCGRTGGHGRGTPQPQWDGSMPKIQPRDVAWAPRIRWIEKWVFTPSFPPIRSQELPQTQSHRHVRLTAIGQSPQSLWSVQWSLTVGYPPAIKHGLLGKPACTLMNVPLKAHPNRNLTDSMMAPVPLTTMSSLHYDRHAPLHPGCWRFRSSVVLHSWHRTTWDLSRPSRCRGSIFLRKTNRVSIRSHGPCQLPQVDWLWRLLGLMTMAEPEDDCWFPGDGEGEGRRSSEKNHGFAMENHCCSKVNIGESSINGSCSIKEIGSWDELTAKCISMWIEPSWTGDSSNRRPTTTDTPRVCWSIWAWPTFLIPTTPSCSICSTKVGNCPWPYVVDDLLKWWGAVKNGSNNSNSYG